MSESTARRKVEELGYGKRFESVGAGKKSVSKYTYDQIIRKLVTNPAYAVTISDFIKLDPKNNHMGASGNVIVIYDKNKPMAVYTSTKNAKAYINGIPNSKLSSLIAGESTIKGYTIKQVPLAEAERDFLGIHLNKGVTIYGTVKPTKVKENTTLDLTTPQLFDPTPYEVQEYPVVVPYEVHVWVQEELRVLANIRMVEEVGIDISSITHCLHVALTSGLVTPYIKYYMETSAEEFMKIPRVGYTYTEEPRYKVVLLPEDMSGGAEVVLAYDTRFGKYTTVRLGEHTSSVHHTFTMNELNALDSSYKSFAKEI